MNMFLKYLEGINKVGRGFRYTYDYGARQYAPLLPMWDRVDPLTEKSSEITPYAYCHDNPTRWIDTDGAFDFENTINRACIME